MPQGIIEHVRQVYMDIDRQIIQYNEQFVRFDPYVSYTLRPGQFVFYNQEYKTNYFVNTMGLRDDEESLDAPEIVVIGDSHAMGWGVNQDETFPQIIERLTGLKVLNASVSSYGTVREMRLLDRIDTQNMKYLIIQYCNNDFVENLEFLNNDDFKTMNFEVFINAIQEEKKRIRYFFGRNSAYKGKQLLKSLLKKSENILTFIKASVWASEQEDKQNNEMTAFFNAVLNVSKKDISQAQLMVLVLNPYLNRDDSDNYFIQALYEFKDRKGYPDFIKNLIVVDLSEVLKLEHGYVLDSHMNASGHITVAKQILKHMNFK